MSTDLHQLEVMLGGDTGLRGGIDIFAGPPRPIGGRVDGGAVSSGYSAEQTGDGQGERTRMPNEEEEERGTYTMYDEYGDPGETGQTVTVIVVARDRDGESEREREKYEGRKRLRDDDILFDTLLSSVRVVLVCCYGCCCCLPCIIRRVRTPW